MGLAAALAGSATGMGSILNSIARAHAIEPAEGSSYLDAEHVVILMQENRSFDHAYGTLSGVRGFNDPRAITLPDGNPVWVQANDVGERFAPFRFDIKSSKVTWMGSLPHSWPDQVDARNGGLYDKWLPAKQSGHREYAHMPLTMGYYTREDIPFYYALADAFTICDQNFCSSLTGTTPNRCYLWSGTIRERPTSKVPANVRNEDADLNNLVSWPTFPERLEALGVSWKVYQNEITVSSGLGSEEDSWLANFGDNPLEYFRQYRVQLAAHHRAYIAKRIEEIPGEIETLKTSTEGDKGRHDKRIAELSAALKRYNAERDEWAGKSLDQLPASERALHERAFTTNTGAPDYRQLAELTYQDGETTRRFNVPKGDILHQFRQDVNDGKLPTVSWLVAPETFSDHPTSAWYGAWYIAEVLDILTRNPEVWKKTVFILTYDENDGYFDHVPPFVAPHPQRPETGKVTNDIDAAVEYVEFEQDKMRYPAIKSRGGPIGLGYRVPLVIVSPWSRGGCVCSQVFDHTSPIQFVEKLLTHKLGKKVEEPNISQWRRTVCGDLTASFQSAATPGDTLTFPPRDAFLESIHRAQFQELPKGFHALSKQELEAIRNNAADAKVLPRQEPGTRRSCPLPYELAVDGTIDGSRKKYELHFEARKDTFGERSAGSPFIVYAMGPTGPVKVRNYAVSAGQRLTDAWELSEFENGRYHLRVYGPNGFFREFRGGADDPALQITCEYFRSGSDPRRPIGDVEIIASNLDRSKTYTLDVRWSAEHESVIEVGPGKRSGVVLPTGKSGGWYDVQIRVRENEHFEKRYAGRVETGEWSTSDPAMA